MGNKSSSSSSDQRPAAPKPQARHDTTAPRNQETTDLQTETHPSSEPRDAVKTHYRQNSSERFFNFSDAGKVDHEGTVSKLSTELRSTVKTHYRQNSSERFFNFSDTEKVDHEGTDLAPSGHAPTPGTISAATVRSPASLQERCFDPRDPTLTFVDGDDDMDFELKDYKSLRAKMSCGHTVTPTSLMNWCQRLLDEGETRFVCGVCDAEWSYGEVYKMALMTQEEIDHFDETLFNNAVSDLLGAKTCPGCKSLVVRGNVDDLRVHCTVCTTNKGKGYDFCWQCLREWKRPSPYPDRCAEEGCINQPLEILRTCAEIKFKDVKNVTGYPSVRACPTCGLLIEHSSEECKNIICPRCKEEFCFVCLRLTEECLELKSGSHFSPCAGGIAPRQTSIPVWKKK